MSISLYCRHGLRNKVALGCCGSLVEFENPTIVLQNETMILRCNFETDQPAHLPSSAPDTATITKMKVFETGLQSTNQ